MKQLLFLSMMFCTHFCVFSQSPQKMSYQVVIRNANNELLVNKPVKMRVSILQASAQGNNVYNELHSATTNTNGLVSIEIGAGTSPDGTFSSINWGSGTYFLKTETDPNNGTNYTITSTTQLLSVPYALHSECVSSSMSGDTLFVGCKKYIIPGIVDINETTGITIHSCGAKNIHNPSLAYGIMTDQEGNRYRTIRIGNQTWMAENLKTTKYRNGISISNIPDSAQWANSTTGAYCSYNNDVTNDCPYGKIYNWHAVTNVNQICPTGWHVPSDDEWTLLTTFLGGASIAGGKMKNTGIEYWLNPNFGATNSSGFSGLPGGIRDGSGTFSGRTLNGHWWNSTQNVTSGAWVRLIKNDGANINGANLSATTFGFSVRCLKDE